MYGTIIGLPFNAFLHDEWTDIREVDMPATYNSVTFSANLQAVALPDGSHNLMATMGGLATINYHYTNDKGFEEVHTEVIVVAPPGDYMLPVGRRSGKRVRFRPAVPMQPASP